MYNKKIASINLSIREFYYKFLKNYIITYEFNLYTSTTASTRRTAIERLFTSDDYTIILYLLFLCKFVEGFPIRRTPNLSNDNKG